MFNSIYYYQTLVEEAKNAACLIVVECQAI